MPKSVEISSKFIKTAKNRLTFSNSYSF